MVIDEAVLMLKTFNISQGVPFSKGSVKVFIRLEKKKAKSLMKHKNR